MQPGEPRLGVWLGVRLGVKLKPVAGCVHWVEGFSVWLGGQAGCVDGYVCWVDRMGVMLGVRLGISLGVWLGIMCKMEGIGCVVQ